MKQMHVAAKRKIEKSVTGFQIRMIRKDLKDTGIRR